MTLIEGLWLAVRVRVPEGVGVGVVGEEGVRVVVADWLLVTLDDRVAVPDLEVDREGVADREMV